VTTSDGTAYYGNTATIHLVAADDAAGMGVAGTYYKLDGGSTISGTPPTTTITVSGAGTHSLEYWSFDLATPSNVEVPHKTLTFNIDRLAPTTTSNAEDSYIGDAVITLSPTDPAGGSGIAHTYYRIDSGPETVGTSIPVPAPHADSQLHTVYFWSVDNAGNIEPTNEWTFNVSAQPDATPPTTTSNASSTYAVPGLIQLTATDNVGGWGVEHTYYRLDGGTQYEGTIVGTGGQGSHTLEFWSVDAAGNAESPHKTASYVVTANDTTAPTTTSDAQPAYNAPAQIHLTATDNTGGSGVAHTYYTWDDGPRIESTLIGVANGSHHIDFWSVDVAGNVEQTRTASFTVTLPETTPPTTTSNALSSYTGTATITLSASDGAGGSGIRNTYFILDGGTLQTGTSIVVSPPVAGYVAHTLEFWSVDNNGNTEGSKVVSFRVYAIPDTVAPTTTSNGVASYTGTATITLTATDNSGGSGVASTRYRVDGGPQQTGMTIVIAAPASGAAGHTIFFWSVDAAGNIESEKTFLFTVNAVPVSGNATLSFRWDARDYAEASLHVENASGVTIASTSLSGYGSNLYWDVTVPAGQTYRMVCDSYYDDWYSDSGSGYGQWTGVVTTGQNYVWMY
jgi:hypothetical protein